MHQHTLPRPLKNPPIFPLQKGLVAWYPFDNRSGAKLYDRCDKRNHGTITGATWVSHQRGSALSFDGVNNKVVTGITGFPIGATARTIIAFIKSTELAGLRYLFGYGLASDNNLFSLQILGSGQLQFHGYNNDVTSTFASALEENVTSHIAISYDGDVTITFYIDNVANEQTLSAPLNTTGTQLGIGYIGPDYAETAFWKGIINNFMVINRKLTAAEIYRLHESEIMLVRG